MWLHRENEYEWKYIGIWMDRVSEDLQNQIRNQNPELKADKTLILFDSYRNAVDMVQQNLKIRNLISSIKNNSKISVDEKAAKINEIEISISDSISELTVNRNEVSIYLNDRNEFQTILLKN